MSINQPALPHAIIAANATDLGVNEAEWEVKSATKRLLSSVKNVLSSPAKGGVPQIIAYADRWRAQGRQIDTIYDLIRCYYSSFSVVRLPVKGRYGLLREQVAKLQKQISNCSERSFNTKRAARLLSTSDQLNAYLQSAFDHFSTGLNRPFNFVEVSLRNKPIPIDFGGHILQLATAIHTRNEQQSGPWIFEALSYMVASCIMLDCVRYRKGITQLITGFTEFLCANLLYLGWAQNFLEGYAVYFVDALKEFCDMYWPCNYHQILRGKRVARCVNASASHEKGHQNKKGVVFASGEYQSEFSFEFYKEFWIRSIRKHLSAFEKELEDLISKENPACPDIRQMHQSHLEHLGRFFPRVSGASILVSHSTCFCCLMEVPHHALPCGHVLCISCLKSYGRSKQSRRAWDLNFCPLHEEETKIASGTSWTIRLKPDFAGVRLLSLDGYVTAAAFTLTIRYRADRSSGGMRGIVELIILKHIEDALGGEVPLRAFFDLIIGTR